MWRVYWDLWLAGGVLIAIVVLGSWAVFSVKRWREQPVDPESLSLGAQIRHYQSMVDNGTLDPQDFERIKAHLENPGADEPPTSSQSPDTSIRES